MNVPCPSLMAAGGLTPTAVPVLALLSGGGMIVVALGCAAYAGRRRLGWGALGLGALAWGVTVALKFAWAIPINPLVYDACGQALPALGAPLFSIYVGALTGIFEVGLVALLLSHTRLGHAAWPRALAFGIGFGAAEALFFGVSSLSSTLAAMLIALVSPPAPLVVARLSNILWVLAPVVERVATVFIHVCANVLIFYAVNTRQARWLALAFGAKTAVDTLAAAFVQSQGVETLGRVWTFESLMLLCGLAGWLGLRWLAPRYKALSIGGAAVLEARLAHGR